MYYNFIDCLVNGMDLAQKWSTNTVKVVFVLNSVFTRSFIHRWCRHCASRSICVHASSSVASTMLMLKFLSALIRLDGIITFSHSMAHFLFAPLVSVSMRWSMSEQRFCVQYFSFKSFKVFFVYLLLFNIQRENPSFVSNCMTQFKNQS